MNDIRAEFEAWAEIGSYDLTYQNGYVNEKTNSAWQGWQARQGVREETYCCEATMYKSKTGHYSAAFERCDQCKDEIPSTSDKLREALIACKTDLEEMLHDRYPERDKYLSEMRRYERDMQTVYQADQALTNIKT